MGEVREEGTGRAKGGRRAANKKNAGGERPGAKANKEAMEYVQKKLAECVLKDDFDKIAEDV